MLLSSEAPVPAPLPHVNRPLDVRAAKCVTPAATFITSIPTSNSFSASASASAFAAEKEEEEGNKCGQSTNEGGATDAAACRPEPELAAGAGAEGEAAHQTLPVLFISSSAPPSPSPRLTSFTPCTSQIRLSSPGSPPPPPEDKEEDEYEEEEESSGRDIESGGQQSKVDGSEPHRYSLPLAPRSNPEEAAPAASLVKGCSNAS